MKRIKVLFLAANPVGKNRLSLDNEIHEVTDKIRAAEHRDAIELISCWATQPDDLLQAFNQHKPEIVHFSGHGNQAGEILLTDEKNTPKPVSPAALKALFETLKDNIRVVIINACYSCIPTDDIRNVVDCVIGMNSAISDRAAIVFAASFYRAIGFGRSVQEAFQQGRVSLMLEGIPEENTPELMCKKGIDPKRIFLTREGPINLPIEPPISTVSDEDIVLLIGAGVSNCLGLPTLDGLLEQTILGSDDVANRIKKTRNVVETYTKHYKARFEELINQLRYYLNIAEMLRKDDGFRNELGGALPIDVDNGEFQRKWRSSLIRCYRIILQEYGPQKINKDSPEFAMTLRFLEELANINAGRLHIYTTNYDCSFQVLASNCQDLTFFTHIDNIDGSFRADWYRATPELEDSGQPSIYVHRFHGCVAWFSNPTRPFGVEEIYGAGGELEIEDDNKLLEMEIKLTSSQAIGAKPAFARAFEEFCEHLKKVKILLVWGYSFRDIEILRYINQAFTQPNNFLIMYIDPYLSETKTLQHIRTTMDDAPIAVNPNFKPIRIDWKPPDGYDKFVEMVIKSLKINLIALNQNK
jgi:hypothetical protein